MSTLRLGTRASRLALAQSHLVVELLQRTGVEVEIVEITTAGDRDQSTPLPEGVGWFTSALQQALLEGRVDFAVHSCKDLPTAEPPGLVIAAVPLREDVRDVLISRSGLGLVGLPARAVVGTSSPRRESQLRAVRPDLQVRTIRGNVDTRLAKLDAGDYDAIILARAGLLRLGLEHRIADDLDLGTMLPAPAQGALAVECRADDAVTRATLAPLDNPPIRVAVEAERAFLATLESGCSFPAAALATLDGVTLRLRALVERDGRIHRAEGEGPAASPAALGASVARRLMP